MKREKNMLTCFLFEKFVLLAAGRGNGDEAYERMNAWPLCGDAIIFFDLMVG